MYFLFYSTPYTFLKCNSQVSLQHKSFCFMSWANGTFFSRLESVLFFPYQHGILQILVLEYCYSFLLGIFMYACVKYIRQLDVISQGT